MKTVDSKKYSFVDDPYTIVYAMIGCMLLIALGALVQMTIGNPAQGGISKPAWLVEQEHCEDIVTTPRRLRKMTTESSTVTKGSVSTTYLLVAGRKSWSAKTYLDKDIVIAWERNIDEYIITRIPLSDVRFKLLPNNEPPTIQFEWDISPFPGTSYAEIFNETNRYISGDQTKYRKGVILYLSEKDWPTDIEIPLNGQQ